MGELQTVRNGRLVYIQGYEFIVSNCRVHQVEGKPVLRFTGTCTPDKRNDDIRNTGYNGGTYGGNEQAYKFDIFLVV